MTFKKFTVLFIVLALTLTCFTACVDNSEYTVNFNENGGTLVESVTTNNLETAPTSQKRGYVFEGWYFTNDFTAEAVAFPFKPKNNITFYAKWSPVETYTRVDATGAESATGDYLLFGNYPQAKVTDATSITALSASAGDLPTADNRQLWKESDATYGDGTRVPMWTIDIGYNGESYRGVYYTAYSDYTEEGQESFAIQYQNGYGKGTVHWFLYQPIKWRILSENGGSAYIMAENGLDLRVFSKYDNNRTIDERTVQPNDWEYSDIREWLNSQFYNTAFQSTQRALIKLSSLENNVTDNVFCPSLEDVRNAEYGFNDDDSRLRKGSDYLSALGSHRNNEDISWPTRTPYTGTSFAVYIVNSTGNTHGYNNHAHQTALWKVGAVPALNIKLA